MRITLLYNQPSASRYHALGEGIAVASVLDSVRATLEALEADGHTVEALGLAPPYSQAVGTLKRLNSDLVFNLFEGFDGRPDSEWMMAGELEHTGLPFTGASSKTLALCLDKAGCKDRLAGRGVPTPAYQLLGPGTVASFSLDFPVIVKPVKEDASHGCTSDSVVLNAPALGRRLELIASRYGDPALVEVYLDGREFSVTVLGGQSPLVLPLSELVYAPDYPGPRVLTFAAKWLPDAPSYALVMPVCPAQAPEGIYREAERLALEAYYAVGMPAYARVDLRSDATGQLFVLEVNPNPDLSPDAGLAGQAKAAGMGYSDLINTILELALEERKPVGHQSTTYAT